MFSNRLLNIHLFKFESHYNQRKINFLWMYPYIIQEQISLTLKTQSTVLNENYVIKLVTIMNETPTALKGRHVIVVILCTLCYMTKLVELCSAIIIIIIIICVHIGS